MMISCTYPRQKCSIGRFSERMYADIAIECRFAVHTMYVQRAYCWESPGAWMSLLRYSNEEDSVLDAGSLESIILHNCNLTDGYMLRKVLSKKEKGVPILNVWIFDGTNLKLLYKTEG